MNVGEEFQPHLDALSAMVRTASQAALVSAAKTKRVRLELERGWSERSGLSLSLADFPVHNRHVTNVDQLKVNNMCNLPLCFVGFLYAQVVMRHFAIL